MGLQVVVLAAGQGRRFHSSLAKPFHLLAGRPLLWHVLQATRALSPARIVVVAAPGAARQVEEATPVGAPVEIAVQERPEGTADALACGVELLSGEGEVLVVCADTPLLATSTLRDLLMAHRSAGAAATVLASAAPDPAGYGRIVRDDQGRLLQIVEERDATARQREITEVNAGVYVFSQGALGVLGGIGRENAQGERYLPDIIAALRGQGATIATGQADPHEVQGVNDQRELAQAGATLRAQILDRLMASGVQILDPVTTYVDVDVEVGQESRLLPLTFLESGTRIGARCVIGPNARITATTVGDGSTVTQSVLVDATVGPECRVGPFAYLRPGAQLAAAARVGSYVEVKQSLIGPGSKVPHLSYVGDAEIGAGVNVGAGTVFVNYDGATKNRIRVGDNAFIGSDTMLVAPLDVGAGAQTAAGSTITKDVPVDALAIERADQRIIAGWAGRRRERQARIRIGTEGQSHE